MQVFMPYKSYLKTAQCLDYRRLGKQRVECKQLLNGQWPNHPVAKMWTPYKYELCIYAMVICIEWRSRGYNDSLLPQFAKALAFGDLPEGKPPFIGSEDYHAAHRYNLWQKDKVHYNRFTKKYLPTHLNKDHLYAIDRDDY